MPAHFCVGRLFLNMEDFIFMGEVDIYDFDKTVYNGDSSVDFWKFCLKKKPVIALLVPWQFMGFALMKLNILSGAKGKSSFFHLCGLWTARTW